MRSLLATVATAALAAAAPAVTADDASAIEPGQPGPLGVYERTGSESSCVQARNIRRTEVIDGRTILFHMSGSRVWMNRLSSTCPRLAQERAFAYQTSTAQLCNGDIIRVLQRPMMRLEAGCSLGRFVELRLLDDPLPEAADGGEENDD